MTHTASMLKEAAD